MLLGTYKTEAEAAGEVAKGWVEDEYTYACMSGIDNVLCGEVSSCYQEPFFMWKDFLLHLSYIQHAVMAQEKK